MPAFLTPVDIANRGLQHCGAERIDPRYGFNEDSKNAAECASCYDKLRRAELRRNVWRFAIRRVILRPVDTTSRMLAPTMWQSIATYRYGALVSDVSGNLWISTAPDNTNNAPGYSSYWEMYFGPLAVQPYDSTLEYTAGEVVYKTPGNGTYKVYMSVANTNTQDPATPTAWSATTTYSRDQMVTYSSLFYRCLSAFNLNNIPSASPAAWASTTTYALADSVAGSDGYIYTSTGNGNLGFDPISDFGVHWTNTGNLAQWEAIASATALNWRELGAALLDMRFVYPIGAGPASQAAARRVYRLPANYLRAAPQDPKAGSNSFLGAPSGLAYSGWDFEGNFIVSLDSSPIMLRFVADVANVADMDDMFCEGLGARVGFEVCEALTQSTEKRRVCMGAYDMAMSAARAVNGIETGPTEPPEDDWVTCRA